MGREFLEVFEEWASSYDEAVTGHDPQYRDVFEGYDTILSEVAKLSEGKVMEFGVGTGNLTEKILAKDLQVIGVEPSEPMRQLAKEKLPQLELYEGDFLDYPLPKQQVDTIVSTYAFHHLTKEEKNVAITKFHSLLAKDGRVVFADTVYENQKAEEQIKQEASQKGYLELLEDLNREYYPHLGELQELFEQNGFSFEAKQRNKFVWLFIAKKQ
ncbi:class I SAM-dependent DNA methyltransferase [Gracilibacillus massiliensis]|uniref:class I SAM-dependent DNA methyltransferase n=1 Tax=Gracilibacillus massiliensis TaxID=1564956 RepID=UPI00071C3825|nr:class I SAM-dependent methyltransferase [Gracilibacillus massiliensis]